MEVGQIKFALAYVTGFKFHQVSFTCRCELYRVFVFNVFWALASFLLAS